MKIFISTLVLGFLTTVSPLQAAEVNDAVEALTQACYGQEVIQELERQNSVSSDPASVELIEVHKAYFNAQLQSARAYFLMHRSSLLPLFDEQVPDLAASCDGLVWLESIQYDLAQTDESLVPCDGYESSENGTKKCGFRDLITVVNNLLNAGIILVIPVIVVALLWAAVKLIAAQGKPMELAKVKRLVRNILIGVFFVVFSWVIVITILRVSLREEIIDVIDDIIDVRDE